MAYPKNIFWIFLFLPTLLIAQDAEKITIPETGNILKPEYHLQVGSSFLYSPVFRGGMNLFANPSVTFPLSKRFSAEGGIIASTSFLPVYSPFEFDQKRSNYNTLVIYGSTFYQATPKLMIYGTGMKQLLNSPLPFPASSFPQNSFSFGSNLKLGRGFTIGAEVHISDGYNFYSPLPGRNYQRSYLPFNW